MNPPGIRNYYRASDRYSNRLRRSFTHYSARHGADAYKSDNLSQDVHGRVIRGETVPVPVGDVGSERCHHTSNGHESEASTKAADVSLSQQKHHQEGFQKFR